MRCHRPLVLSVATASAAIVIGLPTAAFTSSPCFLNKSILRHDGSSLERCNRQQPVLRAKTASPVQSDVAGSISDTTATSTSTSVNVVNKNVEALKRVLEREYLSFFDPMKTEYYRPDVTFDDPLTTLDGVAAYQNNVDMLGGRTLLGKLLFSDAGIVLHSVTGGEVTAAKEEGGPVGISDIVTRWTLRFTFKILPWKPTAVFTGVSVYGVTPTSNSPGVMIQSQDDYWDSINITPNSGGQYGKVDKGRALADFVGQLDPNKVLGNAPSAMRELPYQLLRRGDGYEVRRYPECAVARLEYDRRDEGYETLGSFARGMNPLAPAIMEVVTEKDAQTKYMSWPLAYLSPSDRGQRKVSLPAEAAAKAGSSPFQSVAVDTLPERQIAVSVFQDASTEMAVRAEDGKLRRALERDGLVAKETRTGSDAGSDAKSVMFAQYDAVFSMGTRRGEVWIELDDKGGHPW